MVRIQREVEPRVWVECPHRLFKSLAHWELEVVEAAPYRRSTLQKEHPTEGATTNYPTEGPIATLQKELQLYRRSYNHPYRRSYKCTVVQESEFSLMEPVLTPCPAFYIHHLCSGVKVEPNNARHLFWLLSCLFSSNICSRVRWSRRPFNVYICGLFPATLWTLEKSP